MHNSSNPFRLFCLSIYLLLFAVPAIPQRAIKDLRPTVILISIDGFRADYVDRYKPKTLSALAKKGVQAEWMKPSYPTKTFPNHYTIVTGLYPDHHGIIENNMFDREIGSVFGLDIPDQIHNSRWWGGEPIWVTAEKQGQRAGSMFWPGSETVIGGVLPSYYKAYDHKFPNFQRVDTVLGWLDLPVSERPTVITMYFAEVDDAGHSAGPESEEVRKAVTQVDLAIERLMDGLSRRHLKKKVNLVIVSDHGMEPYNLRNAVVLDVLFDPTDAERIFWVGEFTQIFPKPGRETKIYEAIKSGLPATAAIYVDGKFPDGYRFGSNQRIAPIVVVPGPNSVITDKQRYQKAVNEGTLDKIRGGHGYDNDWRSMRALFIGNGPAFRKGKKVNAFENVDLYELMCKILNLRPAANDGDLSRVSDMLR